MVSPGNFHSRHSTKNRIVLVTSSYVVQSNCFRQAMATVWLAGSSSRNWKHSAAEGRCAAPGVARTSGERTIVMGAFQAQWCERFAHIKAVAADRVRRIFSEEVENMANALSFLNYGASRKPSIAYCRVFIRMQVSCIVFVKADLV